MFTAAHALTGAKIRFLSQFTISGCFSQLEFWEGEGYAGRIKRRLGKLRGFVYNISSSEEERRCIL